MNGKKIGGLLLIIVGALCFVFGSVVASKVKDGEQKIQDAKKGVSTLKQISKITFVTRKIGKMVTKPINKKIQEGSATAKSYQGLSIWLRAGGGAAFVIGIIILGVGIRTKR